MFSLRRSPKAVATTTEFDWALSGPIVPNAGAFPFFDRDKLHGPNLAPKAPCQWDTAGWAY